MFELNRTNEMAIRTMPRDRLVVFLAERGCPNDSYIDACYQQSDCKQCWDNWLAERCDECVR